MAEAEKSLKELENEITCSICQEHYTQPKVLPCLHYYCKQCILKLAERTGKEKPFSCPECCKEAILPEGNEGNLQTAFFVNRFKALYSKQERALSKEEVKCEICTTSQVKAEAFCRHCDKFICEKCVESHPRMKAFDGHEVISLDEVNKMRAKDVFTKGPPSKTCQVHTESLELFCFDCNQLVCRDCTVKDHKDHDFEFNCEAATNKRKELMDSLKPLRDVAASLSHAVEEIQTTEHDLVARGESVANKIQTSFEEFHTIIEQCKQQMLEEARRKMSEKMKNLQGQKENMSISAAVVQSIVDYTEKCVKHCSDDEVMCMHAEIGRRIKREIKEHDKRGRSLVPVEEVDVGVEVRCAEVLEQLLQTKAKRNPTPVEEVDARIEERCVVSLEQLFHTQTEISITQLPVGLVITRISCKAEVSKLSEVILYTTKFCNKPEIHDIQIDCHLKSLHNGSLVKTNIEEIGADQYRIQFTPTLRGQYELMVSVDGKRANCPFPVFVSIPPTQLGRGRRRPVKIWKGITSPRDITVNSVREILVAELDGDVVVFDNEGKRLRSINRSEHQFRSLHGIAVDSEDNIYFTDQQSNQIFKSNKNCSKVQVHEVELIKCQGHLHVAVVGDEVMVTERFNKGRITVYDRELKYVRKILGTGNKSFSGLSSDSHQNVYACVPAISSIQVFSNSGEFLRSFCCDKDGVKRLKSPCGVCVAGQYVYVTDRGVFKIVVFTTEGDYVTSFGTRCHDVCVDQDGFVYATHFSTDQINIY